MTIHPDHLLIIPGAYLIYVTCKLVAMLLRLMAHQMWSTTCFIILLLMVVAPVGSLMVLKALGLV